MLNLFAAREITDKERFIYEHVRGETFVLVPNQYTLVAEEQALRHMGVDCLFDVEILCKECKNKVKCQLCAEVYRNEGAEQRI